MLAPMRTSKVQPNGSACVTTMAEPDPSESLVAAAVSDSPTDPLLLTQGTAVWTEHSVEVKLEVFPRLKCRERMSSWRPFFGIQFVLSCSGQCCQVLVAQMGITSDKEMVELMQAISKEEYESSMVIPDGSQGGASCVCCARKSNA